MEATQSFNQSNASNADTCACLPWTDKKVDFTATNLTSVTPFNATGPLGLLGGRTAKPCQLWNADVRWAAGAELAADVLQYDPAEEQSLEVPGTYEPWMCWGWMLILGVVAVLLPVKNTQRKGLFFTFENEGL